MHMQDNNSETQPLQNEPVVKKSKKGLWWKIPLILLAVLVLLAVAAVIALWRVNDFFVCLTLQGAPEITVEYGQQYLEPGADAYFAGTHVHTEHSQLLIETEGTVDVHTVGDYKLTYSVSYEIDLRFMSFYYRDMQTRIVHVVDSEKPVIKINTNEGSFTIPGQAYEEEGYSAVDNYDGDITASVQRYEKDGKVFYTVADSSGNVTSVERVIHYHDPIAPELVLNGRTDISIVVGGTYKEPGYTATDNCDGDITGWVVVNGTVDTSKSGTYTLEYTVTDSYNNTVTATRVVRVYRPQPKPENTTPGGSNGKVIYLTFDDGPSAHTSRLLDVLDKYNVKATFFVVKTGYLYLLPRIAQSGHTVAIHCYSHDYNVVYASDDAYFNDLQKMQNAVQSYIGYAPTLIRFPGGSSNTVSRRYCDGIMTRISAKLTEMGYKYFDWNVDSKDAGGATTTQEVVDNVIRGIKSKNNYAIVLQHDIKGFSVNAVEQIIQWGLANGYTFKALSTSSPTCHFKIAN